MSPMSPGYAQLEPDLSVPSNKLPSSVNQKKRVITPVKQFSHQTVDNTIDDNTKQKLISMLAKGHSDDK